MTPIFDVMVSFDVLENLKSKIDGTGGGRLSVMIKTNICVDLAQSSVQFLVVVGHVAGQTTVSSGIKRSESAFNSLAALRAASSMCMSCAKLSKTTNLYL